MGKKTLHIIYNIKTWGPFCRGDDESCPYLRFVSLSDQRCLIFDGLNGSRNNLFIRSRCSVDYYQ